VAEIISAELDSYGSKVLSIKDYKKLKKPIEIPDFNISNTGINSVAYGKFLSTIFGKEGVEIQVRVLCDRFECDRNSMRLMFLIQDYDNQTADQFVLSEAADPPTAPLNIGDRIARLSKKAPELITLDLIHL
jgi:hypothetical protein